MRGSRDGAPKVCRNAALPGRTLAAQHLARIKNITDIRRNPGKARNGSTMRKILAGLLALVVIAGATPSQTTGVPGLNDYTMNGGGSGGTSPTDPGLTNALPTLTLKITGTPGHVVVVAAGSSFPSAAPLPGPYWVDLLPTSVQLIFDGTQPGFIFPWSRWIPPSGVWTLTIPVNLQGGETFSTQVGLLNQGTIITTQSLVGTVSNACVIGESVYPATIGGDIPLSDDGGVLVSLGANSFPFYGTTYSEVWVNMNGHLTFTGQDSDFTPSEPDMLSGMPRVAPTWDDWGPNDPTQGTVRTADDGQAMEIEWSNVRHFGNGCLNVGDSNTFGARLDFATGVIEVKHGVMLLCTTGGSPSTDAIVGISPGLSLSSPNSINLDAPGGNTAPGALDALYEDFAIGTFGGFDLGAGTYPQCETTLTFTPTGGVGTGPYTQQ